MQNTADVQIEEQQADTVLQMIPSTPRLVLINYTKLLLVAQLLFTNFSLPYFIPH